jgi:hypothetical protein
MFHQHHHQRTRLGKRRRQIKGLSIKKWQLLKRLQGSHQRGASLTPRYYRWSVFQRIGKFLTDASLLQVERIPKDKNWLRRRTFILFLYETTAYRPSTGSRYNVATAEGLKRRSGDMPTKVAQCLKHSVFGDFYLVRTIVKYL